MTKKLSVCLEGEENIDVHGLMLDTIQDIEDGKGEE